MRPLLIGRPRLPVWALGALFAYVTTALLLDRVLPCAPRAGLTLPEPGWPWCFSRDGRTLAIEEPTAIRVWDWRTGRVLSTWERVNGWPDDVILSPDGAFLALTMCVSPEEAPDGVQLQLWDVAKGKEAARWLVLEKLGGRIHRIHACFSPDGTTLAFTRRSQDRADVCLWDVSGWRMRAVLERQGGRLAFSPDGALLATTEGDFPKRVRVWDVRTEQERLQLQHSQIRWQQGDGLLQDLWLAFTRDGKALGMLGLLASPDAGGMEPIRQGEDEDNEPSHLVRLWDLSSGEVRSERLLRAPDAVAAPEAVWEGLYLVGVRPRPNEDVVDEDSVVDPLTGAELLSFPVRGYGEHWWYCGGLIGCNYSVRPTADGRTVLVLQSGSLAPEWLDKLAQSMPRLGLSRTDSLTSLRMYASGNGRRLAKIVGHQFGCLSPDGRLLATCSAGDKGIRIWDVPPPRPWHVILGAAAIPALLVGLLGVWRRRRAVPGRAS
jgi:WD40 repeat protein